MIANEPTAGNPFALVGRQALVIGGNSGIGLAIAKGLASAGASVFIAGRNQDKLDAAEGELSRLIDGEQRVQTYQLDAADFAALRGGIGQVLAHHGHLDILVNSQGINQLKAAEDFSLEEYSRIMQTNLQSVFFACTEVGRHMLGRGRGSIVNIASLASHRGWQRAAVYAMSKAGVHSLTQTLAAEWAERGVRVNAISPGYFVTDLNRHTLVGERAERALARTPMRRFGDTPELAGTAVYLASDAARFVTGQTIAVDGGFLAAGM